MTKLTNFDPGHCSGSLNNQVLQEVLFRKGSIKMRASRSQGQVRAGFDWQDTIWHNVLVGGLCQMLPACYPFNCWQEVGVDSCE
jgi:hypothetical protein